MSNRQHISKTKCPNFNCLLITDVTCTTSSRHAFALDVQVQQITTSGGNSTFFLRGQGQKYRS